MCISDKLKDVILTACRAGKQPLINFCQKKPPPPKTEEGIKKPKHNAIMLYVASQRILKIVNIYFIGKIKPLSHSLDSCIIEKTEAMHRYHFSCALYAEINQEKKKESSIW